MNLPSLSPHSFDGNFAGLAPKPQLLCSPEQSRGPYRLLIVMCSLSPKRISSDPPDPLAGPLSFARPGPTLVFILLGFFPGRAIFNFSATLYELNFFSLGAFRVFGPSLADSPRFKQSDELTVILFFPRTFHSLST